MRTRRSYQSITSPDEILSVIRFSSARLRRLKWFVAVLFMLYGSAVLGILVVGLVVQRQSLHEVVRAFPNQPFPIAILFILIVLHRQAVQRAAEIGDVRCVGYLLEGLRETDRDVVNAARAALIRLLPQLGPENADLLSPYQRPLLYRCLSPSQPPELVREALRAINAVAGKEAIPYIEAFREDKRLQGPEWEKLSSLALQVLPDLRMRLARDIIERKTAEAQVLQERAESGLRSSTHPEA